MSDHQAQWRSSAIDCRPFASLPVGLLPPAVRYTLRVASAPRDAAGFQLDGEINCVTWRDGRLAARLGPDEFLLIAPAGEDSLMSDVSAALESTFHSLVDISHRHVAFEMSGPNAADILNNGCPLDLADAAFPAGTATRTLLGKCEIVLMRIDDRPVYRVECWRSFAGYVRDFLATAAMEFQA